MHLCMIQSERAHVCVCACVRQSVFPNWLTVSGWLSTAEPIEHLRDREKVREKERKTEQFLKRDADTLVPSSITDIFFTLATFFF